MLVKKGQHSKIPLVSVEEGCQYIYNFGLEDEHKCLLPLCDLEWRYCLIHRESGPTQYKALTNGQYVEAYHEIYKDDEEYRQRRRMEQYRVRHRQTEPKFCDFFARAETQQEYFPHLKYEGYEYAFKKLHEIKRLILTPPADLPSAAKIAREKAWKLLKDLAGKQRESPDDPVIKRLLLYTKELQRDIGQWMSTKTFANIGGKAREVHELCQKLCEPLVLGHCLFVDIEMARIQYFAHFTLPNKRQFYANKARSALSGVEVFCDVALKHSTGERKQLADFLRFYVDAVRVRQAFDADELDHIDLHIQTLDQRATDFAYAYSDEQIVATVQFLSAMHHAEHQLRCGDYDRCSEYLKEAEEIFSRMEWRSIESLHRIASVKTAWALARRDPEHEKYIQNYIDVINRYRCFEYRHGLQELKRRYDKQVPDVNLLTLKDNSLFVDVTFTHIHPFVMPILEGVETRAIPREEESEVMVSA